MPETIAPARLFQPESDEPGERECLRCYLGRMLSRHGCDNTRKWTVSWRDHHAPGDDQLLEELADRGGICCDCEVVMNVWEADGDEDGEPGPGPCPGRDSRNSLALCVRWADWSLRAPGDDYADDDYDVVYERDYDEM